MRWVRAALTLCLLTTPSVWGCSSSSGGNAGTTDTGGRTGAGGATEGGAGQPSSGGAAGSSNTNTGGNASSGGHPSGGASSASGGVTSSGTGGDAAGGASSAGTQNVSGAGGTSGSGTSGGAGSSVSGAGSSGAPPITPPVLDTKSTLAIASGGSGYKVDGNVIYGSLPAQRLDVIYPTGAGPNGTQTLPAVIMFHGGGWIEDHKSNIQSFVTAFLAHGFVVASVEYRLADGTPNGAIAPAAVEDALLAAKWFWDHFDYYHLDKTKYVVTGGSAGGHLALMVGMATAAAQAGPVNPTDYQIAAIVDGYGPTDVADLLKRGTSWAVQWLPANTPDRDAIATRMSPITYVRKDIPPLITVQGANDTTVPVVQSQNLINALVTAGADAQIHLVTGAGHGFSTPAGAWTDAQSSMFGFLTKHGIGK